ncbi:unnamed protein product [Phytomonas sp. Hart1]|nr:unnamed protein product [Phytomonas sp. Hart1]|eukprot:CCW70082.1 unnamed protein product [Phytomonas sp. isolate Hart1]
MAEVVEDRSIEFLLLHRKDAPLPNLDSLRNVPLTQCHWRDAFQNTQDPLWRDVWELKTALSEVSDDTYLSIRNRLFPLAVGGPLASTAFSNRAGHKLLECMEAAGVWLYLHGLLRSRGTASLQEKRKRDENRKQRGPGRSLVFADVCGGPGAFSQALLHAGPSRGFPRIRGFGMTLAGVEGLDWYPALLRADFTPTYGLDGTGDIYKLANIYALASISTGTLLCIADGGFHVDFSIANYQEPISARIVYAQWFAALKILQKGGCLVLKLFDATLAFTRSLLFLSTFLYDTVHIVKPKHSRVVNSERYLVCIDYKGTEDKNGWMAYFKYILECGFSDNDHIPELLPEVWMTSDPCFMQSITEMVKIISSNQKMGLKMILDEFKNGMSRAEESTTTPDKEVEKDD